MNLRNTSLAAVLADQLSKYLVMHFCQMNLSVPLIHNYLYLTYILNPGAAFGFMAGTSTIVRVPFFIAITVGAGMIVYAYQRFVPQEKVWTRFGLGLIWGGAMGNFLDRIFYRKVVDFIDVTHINFLPVVSIGWFHLGPNFPWIFNVADSCITVGIVILMLSNWLERSAPETGAI